MYICIFDNGKLYKLMNIQHSCKYSLISIPIYVYNYRCYKRIMYYFCLGIMYF